MDITYNLTKDVRVGYMERRELELKQCFNARDRLDFDYLENIGHQLKGHARSFGFDRLEPIAKALEFAAFKNDVSMVNNVLGDLQNTIQRYSTPMRTSVGST